MAVSYDEDISYAQAKLLDSVVSLNGSPVHIVDIESSGRTYVNHVANGVRAVTDLSELDLTPVKLGYANFGRFADYFMRIPSRQWKQGLRSSNVTSPDGRSSRYLFQQGASLANMVRGIYPSPADCVDALLNGEAESMAFSRHFSLRVTGVKKFRLHLLYKSRPVGTAEMGDRRLTFNLLPEFTYLSELLEEERNGRP